jgi:uncharacterized membrane protein YeiH
MQVFHHGLELLGVGVAAASGAIAAGRKSLDWMGVLVIALVTAIGGGTVRDLLLDRHPIFWMRDPVYLGVTGLAAAVILVYVRRFSPPERMLLVIDAFSLAYFSINGAQIALQFDHPGAIAVVMGAITGTAGGILRDVLCNEIPLIFRRGELYATAAIAGICAYLALRHLGVSNDFASPLGIALIVLLRLAAMSWGLRLPVFTLPEGR